MLRTASSGTLEPSRWSDWRSNLSAQQAAMVRRYVFLVIILSTLGCLYLWQVNVITDLREETGALRQQAEAIESGNAYLMQQLAQWESPAYIEQQALAAGWRPADAPVYVQLPSAPQVVADATPADNTIAWLVTVPPARTVR
jgi:hypothetical protein